jgi:hypothetical protein
MGGNQKALPTNHANREKVSNANASKIWFSRLARSGHFNFFIVYQ